MYIYFDVQGYNLGFDPQPGVQSAFGSPQMLGPGVPNERGGGGGGVGPSPGFPSALRQEAQLVALQHVESMSASILLMQALQGEAQISRVRSNSGRVKGCFFSFLSFVFFFLFPPLLFFSRPCRLVFVFLFVCFCSLGLV